MNEHNELSRCSENENWEKMYRNDDADNVLMIMTENCLLSNIKQGQEPTSNTLTPK